MTARLSCLFLTLIVASLGNGGDVPSTIGQLLNIPVVSEASTVKKTVNNTVVPVEKLLDEVGSNNLDLKESGVKDNSGGNDGYKRPVRNSGFDFQQPMGGNAQSFSPELLYPYPRYIPRSDVRFGQVGFEKAGVINENPTGFWPVQRPINNPLQFRGPRYPQGLYPGLSGGLTNFAGQGYQNGHRFDPDQESVEFNLDFTWDQIPVHITMEIYPEVPDDIPYQQQNGRNGL